jgi:hypothetical protein
MLVQQTQSLNPTSLSSTSDSATNHLKSNVSSSFPSPVKFPTLTDVEKSEQQPYLKISAETIQEVAMKQCGIPPEEVQLELLPERWKNNISGEEASSHASASQEPSNA